MKILIENEIERNHLNEGTILKIREIIGKDITIEIVKSNMVDDINRLSWKMGKKNYQNRADLYE